MKTKVIAEIGCNHKGDFNIARDLIRRAKECGAWAVKFQKRNPKELLSKEQYSSPHPNPHNSYGKTYGEHREKLEFGLSKHQKLKKFCENLDIVYSSSVWDITSAKEIVSLNPEFIKIGSPTNLRFDIYKYLFDFYTGDIHVSLGMTDREEEESIIDFFEENQKLNKLVLYCCTSDYPVQFEDIYLDDISRLKNYGCRIGFSGHHKGIAIDLVAQTLGVEYIERHFTIDRTWKGTDHAASLEPEGLRKLVRDLQAAEIVRGIKPGILDCEQPQRKKLKSIELSKKNDKEDLEKTKGSWD